MFLVLDSSPSSGRARLREVGEDGSLPVHLLDAFDVTSSLPPVRDDSSTRTDLTEFGVHAPPGRVSWTVFGQQPGQHFPTHHTDTVDLDTVLSGSVLLTAAGKEIELGPGDCVLIAGMPHGWLAGPQGCVLSVVFVGVERSGS